ncbi:hypothetical protein [Chitinophaga arvensicola]|uniref:Lipoprotein n=1 Tax=Chitinophaga arvensicola TaxID=29529 RepID=A0A1I0SAF1_9BACT|nr:hypothetical protein [Chitinophaga arvensicola]SEW53521.1 hypothetical protein SAMN04488122_5532 [Chitinophaga arvensicola]
MTQNKFLIVIAAMLMITITSCNGNVGSPEYMQAKARILNHVKFSGEIVWLKASGNHDYGIIGIKVSSASINEFYDSIKGAIFPYRLRGEYAEFYGYVPFKAKIGNKIILDSDKRMMDIYDNDTLIIRTDVEVSFEERNMKFVRKNSKFKE